MSFIIYILIIYILIIYNLIIYILIIYILIIYILIIYNMIYKSFINDLELIYYLSIVFKGKTDIISIIYNFKKKDDVLLYHLSLGKYHHRLYDNNSIIKYIWNDKKNNPHWDMKIILRSLQTKDIIKIIDNGNYIQPSLRQKIKVFNEIKKRLGILYLEMIQVEFSNDDIWDCIIVDKEINFLTIFGGICS